MAVDVLADFVLRPLAELVLHVAGYLTGYVLVPLATLGRVVVEPARTRRAPSFREGGQIRRGANGKFAMKAELATFCGVLFWVAVAVAVYLHTAA